MKYALFEFSNEKSCEIGETRWIVREDPKSLKNDGWDTDKEVMVAWPTEFAKISKKIVKSSIDPLLVSTVTCVAKVLKFSGKCVDFTILLYGGLFVKFFSSVHGMQAYNNKFLNHIYIAITFYI